MKKQTRAGELDLLFSDHPTPMWIVLQKNLVVKEVNTAALKLFKQKRPDFLNNSMESFFPEACKRIKKSTKVNTKGYTKLGVIHFQSDRKEALLVDIAYKRIQFDGQPCCLVVANDISSALKAEKSAFDFYKAITNSSIVSRANTEGKITYVNKNFIKISGYSEKELLGKNHRILNSGYHPESFWADMWKAITRGATWRAEVKDKAKNGHYFWVDTFIMPLKDASGKITEFLSIRNDITQRKEQKEHIIALNRSLTDFQSAIHGSSIVSMANPKGDITFVNENFVKISGYSKKELLGKNHRIINSGYHPKSFWTNMWRTIAAGRTWRAEVKNKAKDGSFYWVDTFVMPFLDDRGKVREFLSIRNNITDRKTQEESIIALNRSLANFQNAIHGSSIVSRVDPEGNIIYVNENLLRISGYRQKELIGKNYRIFNSGYHSPSFWAEMWKTIKAGKPWRGDIKNKAKDGSYFWLDSYIMPFLDEHGNVKEFISIRNDITARKLQADKIVELNQSLADFQNALQGSSLVSRVNPAGDITYVNENFLKLCGYSETELIGKNYRVLNSGYHPQSFWKDLWSTVKAGKAWRGDIRNKAKDGSYFWLDTYILPFLDEQGNVKEYISIRNDITERKNAVAKIEDNEKKYRLLYENIPSMYFTLDQSCGIHSVNTLGATQLGYVPGELIGQSVLKVFPPALHSVVEEQVATCFANPRQVFTWEIQKVKKDGTFIYVEERAWIEPSVIGKSVLNIICNDITERKTSELALARANAGLSETLIFGKMGSVELDAETQQLSVSAELLQLLNEDASGPRVMPLEVFIKKYISVDYQGFALQKLNEALMDLGDEKKVVEVELEMNTATGHKMWVDVKGIFKGKSALAILQDITIRKHTEEALMKSNLGLSETLIFGKMGRAELNLATFELVVSKELFRLLEVNANEDQTLPFEQFIQTYVHPDSLRELQTQVAKGMDSLNGKRNVVGVEIKMVTATGRKIWVDGKGIFQGGMALGILHDITEKKNYENDLLAKNITINRMLNGITDGFFAIDRDLNLTLVSRVFASHIKMEVEEMTGRNLSTLLPFLEGSEMFQKLRECLQTGKPVSVEYKGHLNPNQIFVLNAYPNEDGLFAFYQDITSQRKAEAIREELLDRFEKIASHVPGFIYQYDQYPDGTTRFEYISKGISEIFGVTAKEALADESRVWSSVHPDDVQGIFEGIIRSGDELKEWGAQYRVIHPITKEIIWAEAKASPQKLDGGGTMWYGYVSDVTEKKKAELELKESHDRFANVVENLPGYVYRAMNDRNYTPLYISKQVEQVTGFQLDEYLEHYTITHGNEIHPDDAEWVWNSIQEAVKNKQNYELEYRIITKQGEEKWVWEKGKGVYDESGALKFLKGFIMDVTERKVIEFENREITNNLLAILNASTDTTYFMDLEGRIKVANVRAVENMKKLLKREVQVGESFSEFLPPDFVKEYQRYFNQAVQGTTVDFEARVDLGKQEYEWLHVRFLPVKNEQLQLIGVSYNSTDITERKSAELALKQSEERFKFLYNETPAMLHSIDKDGRLTGVSDYWLQKMEYTREEVLGKKSVEFLTEASRKRAVEKVLPEFFSTGHLVNEEYEWVTKSGKVLDTLLSASSEYDDEGNVVRSLAVNIDVSEKKKLEKEILKTSWLYEFTSHMNQMVIHARSKEQIFSEACRIAVVYGKFRMAWFGVIDRETDIVKPVAVNGFEEGYLSSIPPIAIHNAQTGNGPTGTAAREGHITINNNIADESNHSYDAWRDEALTRHYRSSVGVPILVNGEVTGVFTLYQSEPFFFADKEVKLLEEVSDNISFGLSALEIEKDRSEKSMALADSEERFRTLVRDLNVGILLQGPQAEMLLSNEAAHELLGLTESQLLGRSSFSPEWNVIHEDGTDFPGQNHPVPQAIANRQPVRNVIMGVYRPATKDRVWLLVDAIPRMNENGQVKNVICTFNDITQLKEAERTRRESEERFRVMADAAPVLIWMSGTDKLCYYFNKGWLEFTGKTLEHEVGNGWATGVHPDDLERCVSIYESSFDERKEFRMEYRLRRHDGQYRWIVDKGIPRFLASGEFVGYIGSCFDIHDLFEAKRELQESEERLRSIIQTEPNCIKMLDAEGKLLQMNDSGLNMIEADSLEQVIGRRVLSLVDEPFRESFNQLTQAVIKNGKTGLLQFSITGIKGTKRWLETHAVPFIDSKTGYNLLLGITRDITEQKSRSELIDTISELQQTFIAETNTKVFFDFALDRILKNTGAEYGFIAEVLYENGVPYLKTNAITNIAWDEHSKFLYEKNMLDGFVFKNLNNLLGVVVTTGKPVIANNPDTDPRSGGLMSGHPPLKSYAGIPIYKGEELIGVLGLANKPGGYTDALINDWEPLTKTLSNILEAHRTEKERKHFEKELLRTTERLELAHKASGLGVLQVDFGNNSISCDSQTQQILGIDERVISVETYWRMVHPEDYDGMFQFNEQKIKSTDTEYFGEFRIVRPNDGETRYIKAQGLIFRNDQGRAVKAVAVVQDQTKEKQYEISLLSSLQEKEMLIKEIHHRVKNNLQLISSMLYLKMLTWNDPDTKEFMTALREKIKSVSLIHERLLQTESLSSINIQEYLQRLIKDIEVSYHQQDTLLTIQTDIEPIHLSSDYATSLGQLVNELLINSIKHAFINRNEGIIRVSLHKVQDGYRLIVQDNGVGLPETIVPQKSTSYGMQLIQIFVKQLKGTMEVIRQQGTTFRINFKVMENF